MAIALRIAGLLSLLLLLAAAGPETDTRLVLAGRVVDELGRPVAGAEVRMHLVRSLWVCLDDPDPAGALAASRTSADGTYRVADPDVFRGRDGGSCYCCEDVYLSVRSGRGLAMSGAFLRGTGRLDARDLVLSKPFVLAGRVTDPEGRPVSLAEVSLDIDGMGNGEEPGMGMSREMELYTDERGEYAFVPIPVRPGYSARITIRHNWYEELTDPTRWPEHLRMPFSFHMDREVTIEDLARRPRLDVTLLRGLTIRGRALDPDGEPMPGIKVWCAWRGAKTGPDGCFVIRGARLTGGPIAFSGHRPDRRVRVPAHDAEAIVTAGDFVLRKRPPEPKAPATIKGTIVGPDGRTRLRRWVYARRLTDGEVIGRAETDNHGRFSIDLDTVGPVRLTATAYIAGGELAIDEVVDPSKGPVQLAFPFDGVLRLEFENGTPAGVEIEVDGKPAGGSSCRGGSIRLKLPAGPHRLRLILTGGPTLELDVESVPTDPERTIRVPLPLRPPE